MTWYYASVCVKTSSITGTAASHVSTVCWGNVSSAHDDKDHVLARSFLAFSPDIVHVVAVDVCLIEVRKY